MKPIGFITRYILFAIVMVTLATLVPNMRIEIVVGLAVFGTLYALFGGE